MQTDIDVEHPLWIVFFQEYTRSFFFASIFVDPRVSKISSMSHVFNAPLGTAAILPTRLSALDMAGKWGENGNMMGITMAKIMGFFNIPMMGLVPQWWGKNGVGCEHVSFLLCITKLQQSPRRDFEVVALDPYLPSEKIINLGQESECFTLA